MNDLLKQKEMLERMMSEMKRLGYTDADASYRLMKRELDEVFMKIGAEEAAILKQEEEYDRRFEDVRDF